LLGLLVARTIETQGRIGVKVVEELGREGIAPSTLPVFNAEPKSDNGDILGRDTTKIGQASDFARAAKESVKNSKAARGKGVSELKKGV
jgi:hypothetical protein